MSLIKSISGIRGTIGGKPGEGLTPLDIVKFVTAFAVFLKSQSNKKELTIILGRDARISGEMVNHLVVGTLTGMGVNVIDTGLSTTPTVEMAVIAAKADGGIILTASHNPAQWNALKLLNERGEFISAADGEQVLELAGNCNFDYASVENIGSYSQNTQSIQQHIDEILALPLVDVEAISGADFKIAIDCVNSTGGIALPMLLNALGVKAIEKLYCEPTGIFPHNPEPLPENLVALSDLVVRKQCHLGFAVDPDVDRLAIVCENGQMFGEEYTLVAVSDYVLSDKKGNTVSNMSSTQALRDVTEKYGGSYFASAVGEVNVVEMMKKTDAVIGGEGNGGIIYPELHYGRDALIGIALFLSHLAKKKLICSNLRDLYPDYAISKNKIELTQGIDVDMILANIAEKYKNYPVDRLDGVKIDFGNEWVHLRKSNTEPIIRIYTESDSITKADHLAKTILDDIAGIVRQTL